MWPGLPLWFTIPIGWRAGAATLAVHPSSVGDVAVAERRYRRRRQGIRTQELLERQRGEGRTVHEEIGIPGAGIGDVRVARGVDDDEPAPAPRAAFVLEHRQDQQVL